jgi:ATP phosphoribosyltransferase regulatory subunit
MGGRYDDLLGRYGAASPATGFAFEVDNVLWALSEAGVSFQGQLPLRVVVAGGNYARSARAASAWRARGARAAVIPAKSADEAKRYAKAWSYDLLVWQRGSGAQLTRLKDGRKRTLKVEPSDESFSELVSWARVGNES